MKDQPKTYKLGRHSLLARLQAMMEDKYGIENYDPLVRAVDLVEQAFKRKIVTEIEVADIHIKVTPYIHAKIRQIDLTGGEDENGPKPVKLELLTRLKEALD
jgi:hypothetical protein